MLDPRKPSPPGKEDQKSDILLFTRIGIPRIRPDLLARSRLIRRLEQAVPREFILVNTPAGFGKTTILASWVRSTESPVAGLSLDGDDKDSARFWRYVTETVDRVHEMK